MNTFKSNIKPKTLSFTVLLFCITLNSFSQGPTGIGYNLESCYQILDPTNSNTPLNVLNIGKFHFNYSINAGARPDHIRVKMYDAMHGFLGYNYHAIGLADNTFPVLYHPYLGELVTVAANDEVNGNVVFNTNYIVFPPEVATIEITAYHWTGDAGSQTLDENTYKMTLNLLDASDAFSFSSGDKDCFTFDDFRVNLNHSLDGFCANITESEIEALPPFPTGSGWKNSPVQPIVFGRKTTLTESIGTSGKSWCQQEINTQTAPWNFPTPVPSGCINFTLRFKITPCSNASADCPDVGISMPLTICCSCDIRPVGPKQ